MYYTGIGSRETPTEILNIMNLVAIKLQNLGYILRSGGAPGADLAFEEGISNKDIYIPWRGFNGSKSSLINQLPKAFELASEHHPAWNRLTEPVRKLMARNAHQVLGHNLDIKSKFVICWTPDGAQSSSERTSRTGGTGLAISLASSLGIKVFNLQNQESYDRVIAFLNKQ